MPCECSSIVLIGKWLKTLYARLAYRYGVTAAVAYHQWSDFLQGTSVFFRTGSKHALEEGAIIKSLAAIHVGLHHSSGQSPQGDKTPGVSTKIATIRRLLDHGSPEGHRTSQLFYYAAHVRAILFWVGG